MNRSKYDSKGNLIEQSESRPFKFLDKFPLPNSKDRRRKTKNQREDETVFTKPSLAKRKRDRKRREKFGGGNRKMHTPDSGVRQKPVAHRKQT